MLTVSIMHEGHGLRAAPMIRARGVLLLCGAIAWPSVSVFAAESVPSSRLATSGDSSQIFLPDAPLDAQQLGPLLRQVVHVVTSTAAFERDVKALRAEQDGVKTRLTTAEGELQTVERQRQQLTQQLEALERQQQGRLEGLRKELEANLVGELTRARQHVSAEQAADFTRQVQVFEARQQDAIGQSLDQELFLKERELDQLSQEIDVQTQELLDRLSRLDVHSDLAKSLERSTTEAIAKRKAQLAARRQQLTEERNTRLATQRREFIEKLKQHQGLEQERRVTLKEASLRSSMAELLHKAQLEDAGRVDQARRAVDDIRGRHTKLTQQRALLATRIEAINQELAAKIDGIKELEGQRKTSMTRLEQAFHHDNPGEHAGVLTWFGRVIQQLPAEAAAELGGLHQRLAAIAEQEQKLREQRRMLRERQLALQVSREVESQYQALQAKQRREQDSKARRAEELVTQAHQFAGRGQYDEALQLLAQAQTLNPPQAQAIAAARDELLMTRERVQRQTQTVQVEQLFSRAMKVFEQGRYEEAVALFQQVIDQEAKLGTPRPMAGGGRP
ncbi:MAG: hypothetical protein HY599_05960 [Candidatus Omnitrophica bacterium]|nr:hypothetical protein [Candidatus Omnitrophota bacterium]